MAASHKLLTLRQINVKFGNVRVLRGASIDVDEGERVAIIGPSGSGKSTMLFTSVGLVRPQAGSVRFADQDLLSLSDRKLSAWRRHDIGFVFQFGHLINELTVTENVAMPLLINGESKAKSRKRAHELIERFGLQHLRDRFPDQVSGGELQRIAVARAAAHRPRLIVADEPTGALDSKAGEDVLRLLLEITGPSTGSALIMVTHDHAVAEHADRVVGVKDGRTSAEQALSS